jgi:Gluconate 2-dehydrogenase subunit 3
MDKPEDQIGQPERIRPDEGKDQSGISRREFIRTAVAASAVATVAASSSAAAVTATASNVSSQLSAGQHRVLELLLNRLIPAEGAMPAAGDLGIVSFIDTALDAAPHLRPHVMEVLAALPEEDHFSRMPDEAKDALLESVAKDHEQSFDLLLQATYTGYYSHAKVQQILGWVDPVDRGYGLA